MNVIIKLFKKTLHLSFLFSVVFCLLLVLDSGSLILWVVLSVTAHELGHIAALYAFGSSVKAVHLTPFGLRMDVQRNNLSYKKEIQAALAGPLVNFILFLILILSQNTSAAYVNGALFVFNMLPVQRLDGGNILSSAALVKHSPDFTDKLLKTTSVVCTMVFLVLLTASIFFESFNITLLLATVYLAFLTLSGAGSLKRKCD